MLDPRRLQAVCAVVQTGSVTAAAALLGYTPSAVSQNIAALEKETATTLFEKSGRGVRPTAAALLLAEHGEAVISRLYEAETALDSLRAGESGRIRLAAFFTAGATLVPQALALFRSVHPSVGLDLGVAETDEAMAQLRSGSIDVAVIAEADGPPESDGLVHTHLLDDPYRVILPRAHRLASRRSIALTDLSDDPWVGTTCAAAKCAAIALEACIGAGFAPQIAIESDEFATTVGFVAAGLGVALVPLLALGAIPEDVRVRPVRGEQPRRRVYAVIRPASSGQPTVSVMVDALRRSAAAYVTPAA